MTEEVIERTEEEQEKLNAAWKWVTEELVKQIIDKENELKTELFYPTLMAMVDVLRVRGMPGEEVLEGVAIRTELDIDEPEEEVEA